MITPHEIRHNENGNVIFYIFIAIALLAALSFAVSQGMRGGGKALTEDRSRLAASEVIAYGDTLAKAAGQMRLRNIPLTSFSFAHPNANPTYGTYNNNPAAEIFNPQGGGVIFRNLPDLAVDTTPVSYVFTGSFPVQNVGTSCTSQECSEIIVAVQGIKPEVCQLMNHILGLGLKTDPPPEDDALPTGPLFEGTPSGMPDPFSYTAIIGDETSSDKLKGKTAGCYYNPGSSSHIYYQVLVAR